MKNVLLTTTTAAALVAFSGAAYAQSSLTWSGGATAGIAIEGGTDEIAAGTQSAASLADGITVIKAEADIGDNDAYKAAVQAQVGRGALINVTEIGPAGRAQIRVKIAEAIADMDAKSGATPSTKEENDKVIKTLNTAAALLDATFGAVAVDAKAKGDAASYAEVNATLTGTVDVNGIIFSAAVSIDAGEGYTFGDDDGFDSEKTNGVALDWISIDAGAAGVLVIDKDDIAHLVDGDDDGNGDIKYTNNFSIVSFAFVMDLAKDTNPVAASAGKATIVTTPAVAVDGGTPAVDAYTTYTAGTAAVAADVQWSVKLSAPIADIGTVYAAFDEAGGNAFGGSATFGGFTVSVDSKLEALESTEESDRSNTVKVAYAMGGITAGASWNSIEDGNQWGLNAGYAVDAYTVGFSTNEGEEWAVTGSYALSASATVSAGVNYTEDAFMGVSFTF